MIDHIEAFSSGGTHGEANFAVACAKCNGRKSNREKIAYLKANPRRLVRG
jgi:5-methylcytosine-specific restriction endonuclease McrA